MFPSEDGNKQGRSNRMIILPGYLIPCARYAHVLLFSRVLRDSAPRNVGQWFGRLVGLSVPFIHFRRF